MTRKYPQRTLVEAAAVTHGIISIDQAAALDVAAVRLSQMVRRGALSLVSRGIYRVNDLPSDDLTEFMAAALWPRRGGTSVGVISHDSALLLHDLCDVHPDAIHITIPATYRLGRRAAPDTYRFHRRDLNPTDITYIDHVPVVTPFRAVLDGVQEGLRESLILQAIESLQRQRAASDKEVRVAIAALERRAENGTT